MTRVGFPLCFFSVALSHLRCLALATFSESRPMTRHEPTFFDQYRPPLSSKNSRYPPAPAVRYS